MAKRLLAATCLITALDLACSAGTSGGASGGQGPTSPGPVVLFTDVVAGATAGGPGGLGVPIALFGKGFGATRGSSTVTIGGVEVASYLAWGEGNAPNPHLDMIVVQPGALAAGGPVLVNVQGHASNAGIAFTPVPSARVLVVARGGSDAAACTEAAPCATMIHALSDLAGAGDAVLVRAGQYQEQIWFPENVNKHPATALAPKVVKSWPGERVTLTGSGGRFTIVIDHLTISGLDFQDGRSITLGDESNRGNQVVACTFAGAIDFAAVGTHGEDLLVAGNVCTPDGSSQGTEGHCFYVSSGAHLRLLWNVTQGSWPGYGIHVFDQRRATPDIRREIHDLLVEGNVISGSSERSGMIISMEDEGGYGNNIDGVVVRNNVFTGNNHNGAVVNGSAPVRNLSFLSNTFYRNGRQGLDIEGTAAMNVSGVVIENNLFDTTPNDSCKSNCGWFTTAHLAIKNAAAVTVSHNGYAPAPVDTPGATDPVPFAGPLAFLDGGRLDLRLPADGLGLDQGLAVAVERDFRGMPRPQGAGQDLGAFERGPGDP